MSDKRKKAATAAKLHKDSMPCNKPKKTPNHPTKSHVVKACEGGKEKIIHFGQQGVSGSPKKKVSQKHIASVEKALKLDIQKILQKERCLLHIGQIALSGDLNGKSKRKHDSEKRITAQAHKARTGAKF
jgi:hypothetical protein